MDTAVEAAVPFALLVLAVAVTAVLLTRQRSRVRPTDLEPETQVLLKASKKQRRMLEKLDPLPEIPSVMDLMRQEIEETGVEEIPGHEGLAGPVMLKVFRRDQAVRDRCTHNAYKFVIDDGLEPATAMEDNVRLYCDQCDELDPLDEPGTETETETL